MKKISVYSLEQEKYVEYEIPSKAMSMEHSERTWGTQWDAVERKHVEGGLPLLWNKVNT